MPRGSNYMPHNRTLGSRTRERLCDSLFRQDKSQTRRYSPYASSRTHQRHTSPLRSIIRNSPSPARVRAGEATEFIPGRERYYSPNSRRLYEAPIDWNSGDAYSVDDNYACYNSYNNNSDWTSRPTTSHYHRSDDVEEDFNIRRFRSPPRPDGILSLYSLNKRMDHFDSLLTKLVNEVSERKRHPAHNSLSPSAYRQTNSASEDMDKLDRMMDDLHIMKRSVSPSREGYRPLHSSSRNDSISHISRNRYRR